MTSQINDFTPKNQSIRLQRLAKTMDLYSHRSTSVLDNTSELVKLPALRAINKSVKYNDLSFATSRDLSKLRKQPEQPENIEELSAHHTLVVVRKRYDNMNKNRMQLQKAVDILQKQHDKLSSQKELFESSKQGGNGKVSALQTSLKQMKLLLQETDIDKKIMLNMINRLKHDKVVYDLRKYNMEKDLTHISKAKAMILKESEKQKEHDENTEKFKSKLLIHLEAEKKQRDAHIQSVEGMLAEKEDLVTGSEIRKQEMQEVALNTLQDKSKEEKNWYKVYLCHRFVEKLLRDKMNREMVKFNVVEVAFKNIKTATGVNSAETMVKKFLSKENTYGDLLGKIAEDQRVIAGLKAETEELRQERRSLEAEQQQLNSNKVQTQDLSQEEKQMNQMSNKSQRCYTYLRKMDSWLVRNLKKFDITEEEGKEQLSASSSFQMITRFKAYLQTLNTQLDRLASFEEGAVDLTAVNTENNCRVKIGSDNSEQIERRHHTNHNEHDEEDYVNGQRQELLRNNQKFMKELKKKYEEVKQAMIDSMPKRKQVIPEKPKPAPVDA